MSDGQQGGSSRRDFLKMAGVAGATATALSAARSGSASAASGAGRVPAYLEDYADLYKKDPRKAALQWLQEARFGLFLHFGPSVSWLGRLPGDIRIERPGLRLYVPITTSILISVVVSLVLWVIGKLR